MDRIKATMLLAEIKGYLTAGNPVWDVDEIAEALDIAIEALEMQDLCAEMLESAKPVSTDGDLISRQDALDAFGLSKNTRKYGGDHSGYDTRMLYEIQDVLESLPSAEPNTKCIAQIRVDRDDLEDLVNEKVNEMVNMMSETKTGEWIPVSERLPKTGDSVLVTYSDGEVGIIWSARPKKWVKYIRNNLIYPIAWMPLPEPYKGGEEE